MTHPAGEAAAHLALKILIAGGFGAGKTTLVGAVSEISPLSTEQEITDASQATDPLTGVEHKTTTTVALDFGRITLTNPQPLVLMLFGTPGQDRFIYTWNELSLGALGAVVLCDTRRLDDSFAVIDYFEERGLPFIVAVNQFDGHHSYSGEEIRAALRVPEHVPIKSCDARDRTSALAVLITLVNYVLSLAASDAPADPGTAHTLPCADRPGAHPVAGPGAGPAPSSVLGAPW